MTGNIVTYDSIYFIKKDGKVKLEQGDLIRINKKSDGTCHVYNFTKNESIQLPYRRLQNRTRKVGNIDIRVVLKTKFNDIQKGDIVLVTRKNDVYNLTRSKKLKLPTFSLSSATESIIKE